MTPGVTTHGPGTLRAPFGEQLAALRLAPGRVLAAVSGGPDSVALLDLLAVGGPLLGLEVVVGHVDHGIDPRSAAVAEGVRRLAGEYGLPLVERRLALGPEATETAARRARYQALEAMRRETGADWVATAHHADDRAETVLMRVLRGTGPAGLAPMAARMGRLIRPLLPFRRDDLARHLRDIGRTGWADPANADPRHLRSWLRGSVLPALRDRLPDIDARLIRVADQAALNRSGWDALLDAIPDLELTAEPDGISVASGALETHDRKLLICIVMAVARRCGFSLGPTRASRVADLVDSGGSGDQAPLGGGWIAELAFGRLRLVRPPPRAAAAEWILGGERGADAWAGWRFAWTHGPAPERQERAAADAWFEPAPLLVRGWREGEKVSPLGGRGRRLVVRCLQEARIPRTSRREWPVLEWEGSVVWVAGVCRSDLLVPRPGTEALRVHVELA